MAQDIDWDKGAYSEPAGSEPDWDKGSYSEPPKPRTRGVFEAINDTVIEGANAAAGGVSAAANFFKPGNAVSEFIDENIIRAGEAKQSDVVRAEKKAMAQGIQEADGIGGELAAVGKYVVNNPALAAAQAAGSFVMPGAAAKVLGRVGGIGAGAAMAGGDAAGTAYDLSKQAGATEDQAVSAGRQASVIPAAVGGVTGAFGAERILAGGKGFAGNAASRALKTGASEAGQEAIEEGVTAFEGQRAAMPYDATIDPTKGVAAAAGMGAVMGGAAGAGVSLLSGGSESAPTKATSTTKSAGAQAFASGQPMTPPAEIKSVAEKAQWVRDWQDAAAASMTTAPGAAGQGDAVTPSGDVLPEVPGGMAGVQRTFDPRAGGKPPISMLQTDAGGNAIDFEASPEFDRSPREFQPLKESEPTRALGFNPLAGTPRVFPDGTVSLGSDQDEFTKFIPSRATQIKRSEQMGLNPSAGPMSAAAATAVDSGASDQVQQQTAMAQAAEVAAQEAKKPAKKYAHRVNGTLDGKSFQTMVMAESPDEAMVAAVKASPGLQPSAAEPVSKSVATQPATTGEPTNGTTPTQAVEAAPQGREAQPAPANLKSPRGILAKKADAARAARTANDQAINPATATDAGAVAPPAAGRAGVSGIDEQGAVQALNSEWQQFPDQTGTLNVPRAEMPQVKNAHRGPMVNFLNARGVTHEQVEVDPATLKPTQSEFSQTKVQEAADRDTDRSILISADGYVIDGHHQAIAKLQNGKPVRAIRLNATAEELLPLVREFPSSTTEQSNVQDPQSRPAGAEAQAAPVEASTPARGDAAEAAGVPAAPGASDVQADGVKPRGVLSKMADQKTKAARRKSEDIRDSRWESMNLSERERVAEAIGRKGIFAQKLAEKRWDRIDADMKVKLREVLDAQKPAAVPAGNDSAAQPQPKQEPAAKAPPAEPEKPEPAPQPKVEKPSGKSEFKVDRTFLPHPTEEELAAGARYIIGSNGAGERIEYPGAASDVTQADDAFMGSKRKPKAQGTPTDRAVMAMAGEGKSADEILRFIAGASKSPFNRQIANLLRRTKANPAVSIGGDMGGGAGFKFLAKYSRKNHEVTLSEGASGKAEQIFLHETVHAATLLALDRGGEHAARMKALYESVKAQGLADAYGMKNVGEFVAEAFTNPEFQKELKGFKAPGGTAWDRFVAAVRRILGLSDRSQDALSAALELGVDVMRENMPLRAARSFSAEDAPEYFGMADAASLKNSALEQIKQFDVKTAPKNTWAHYRGMAMQALGRRQIVDLYAEELPQLEHYNDLVQRMDAEKNESGAEADNLAHEWGKLKNGEDRTLAELMHDATLAQMDPSKAQEPGTLTIQYKALEARHKALTPEAKALFAKARDMYKDHYTAVQKAIKERIERSEMSDGQKRQIMARMDEELFKELKGVYFPLARFGQYVIVVKDANGEVKNVTRSETVKEAEAARKELQKAFPAHMGNTVGKVLKQAEFNAGRDAVGKGFMADLMGALDNKGVDDELRDTVAQLYLSSLPDLSWAKHGIHRKGTPGFSQDARRAFAQNMFHGARYLAKLRYADQLQDQLTAMQDHIKAYEGVEEYDSVEAQQVVDEMVKRHEFMMNPKSSPVSTALTSFGFLFHMGLSPASAMVNLTQTALVAFPQMGAKWGFGKASAALIKASEETVRAKNDLSKVLKGDELDALNRAINDGTIDVTMAHDLAGIAQGEDQGVMWKVRPVMRAASFMFHHAEKFNRQATFLAAYRLAKEANPTRAFDRLYEDAQKATYDGHFDYSTTNRPRMMQGNWQRVILLFKTFAQNMIYTLARNAYQSIKAVDPKERTQARKAIAGMLATHAAAAGVLGLPIVGPLLTIASFLGSDDDEPWDAEVAMQNAMAELVGPKAAEVMARGLSRLTPWDLSGRVALDKLILPDVQEGLEGKEWAESAMAAALGPVAGIGVNVARGMQKITDGDYMRGIEDMLPTALRGPIKALRYAQEGAVDKTGIVITDEVSAAGVIGQASGFSPSQVRRDTERRSAIYGYDRALLERRSVLMRMFADAQMNGDTETVLDVRQDIAAFNEKNPTRRITVPNLMQSVRNRQRRIDQAQDGIYLPKNRRDALDAVTF